MNQSPNSFVLRGPRPMRSARGAGFTLIEVLVAMIVLVLGVLGAAAMTLTAVRDSKQSALRSQASALAYQLSDLMRASRYRNKPLLPTTPNPYWEAVWTGSAPTSGVSTCWTTGCSPADMAKNDYYEWRQKLQNATTGLPNGDAVICRDSSLLTSYPACDGAASSPLVVKLKWDEKNNNARGASSPAIVTPRYMVVTIQPYDQ